MWVRFRGGWASLWHRHGTAMFPRVTKMRWLDTHSHGGLDSAIDTSQVDSQRADESRRLLCGGQPTGQPTEDRPKCRDWVRGAVAAELPQPRV